MATALRSQPRVMTLVDLPSHDPAPAIVIHRFAALLVLTLAAVARLIYLIHDCPYDLAPDEAHYWDWSRHLDWSYYSKGPGVAWLIRASTELFGNTMWAVRLPAVLCGGLTLLGLFELTWRVYRSPRRALGAVLLGLTVPALAVGSLLMTIDAPYVCCWTWALVVAHAACFPGRPRSTAGELGLWALLGLLIGVGILIKYTMVIFVPSLALFVLMAWWGRIPEARRLASGLGFTFIPIAIGVVPIVIWNAQHEWVTFFHVGRQAGAQNGAVIYWLGPLEYLGGQFAALFGFWFVWWLVVMISAPLGWRRTDRRPLLHEVFLWCLSLPMVLVFLAFSLKTRVELNWPITAYLAGAVLLAEWVARQCDSEVTWYRRLSRSCVAVAAGAGLALIILMHHSEWLYPYLGATEPGIRRWDPTCRLRGWQTLATEVECMRSKLRAEGTEPILAATGWALPGELGFYLPDHPEVYSFALACGGRRSQYDFWRPNPIWDPEMFQGRTVICVGELSPSLRQAFKTVEPTTHVTAVVHGRVVATWPITVCSDFKGFVCVGANGY